MKFPWENERYYRNDDGLFNFMPRIHRPEKPDNWDGLVNNKKSNWRPLHDDWPYPFNKVVRTWTSFEYVSVELLEGDPKHWIHPVSGQSFQGDRPSSEWVPKAWGIRGTYQKTKVTFRNPVTKEILSGIYQCRVYSNGLAWRKGVRFSDDDIDGKPAWYVNWAPGCPEFLTFGTKKIA